MNALWLVFSNVVLLTSSVTVNRIHRDIVTKSRIELKPVYISCFRNDIILISAPIINDQSMYYLNKPNGDIIELNITSPKTLKPIYHTRYLNFYKKKKIKPIVIMETNTDVFSLKQDDGVMERKQKQMESNEFLLGPVGDEDHGNWVLSIYAMDYNADWIEMFKVISVEIVEYVLVTPASPKLTAGSTFHLSFAYPIPNLVSCELVAPRSTFDRIFERSNLEVERCHFVLRNISKSDAGVWRIVGVGNIIFEGTTELSVT